MRAGATLFSLCVSVCMHTNSISKRKITFISCLYTNTCTAHCTSIYFTRISSGILKCVQRHTNDRPQFGVPSILLWHRPWCQYIYVFNTICVSCIEYLTCWRAHSLRKMWRWQGKATVSKKYGYFYWIFTSFHKIVCIVFAMDLPLCCVRVRVCFVI